MMEDALAFWNAIKGKVATLCEEKSKNCLRREKYDVTTAPNGTVIGVTQPYGKQEIFIPYESAVATAVPGDSVFVEWWNSLSNARAMSIIEVEQGGLTVPVEIEQGGTGATTAAQALENLGLGGLTVPVEIEQGGTGATTAGQALENLGLGGLTVPVEIEQGGTGATTADQALENLGITYPTPVAKGGTGATTAADARTNLGITYPTPIEKGGTGATTVAQALENLGISQFTVPVPISSGGTGATTAADARTNLQTMAYGILPDNVDFNTCITPGCYRFNLATNGPVINGAPIAYGQILVVYGGVGDTIAQIVFPYTSNFSPIVRYGNPPDVGGTGTWTPWYSLVRDVDLSTSLATKSNNLYVAPVDQDDISCSGGSYVGVSIPATLSGYTPIGLVGWYVVNASTSGINQSWMAPYMAYLNGTDAYFWFRNYSSNTARIHVYAYVLYVAN